jgi:imidazole glycerol-phosphate synthase subunit HisH
MSKEVVLLDYGLGNLFSVRKALEHCGATVTLSEDPEVVLRAGRLVLPGVGAFRDGMAGLRVRHLIEPVLSVARSGKPVLGICLGMQMLMAYSEEFGRHEGLGVVPGGVLAIAPTAADGTPHRIPHIGWNSLEIPYAGRSWSGTILEDTPIGSAVYLVHSFTAWPEDERFRLADCTYGGRRICAAVQSGNIYGCQFHPEKSAQVGLSILRRFLTT